MANIEWDKELHDFPAYVKYNELNKVTGDTHNTKEFCDKYWILDEKAKNFCRQAITILRGITYTHGKNSDECHYFKHWFSDQVRRYYSNNDKFFSNYDPSNYLFDAINKFNDKVRNENYRCYASRDAENVKVEKDLYDYFQNFDSINCDNISTERCQMYYKYVNYINGLYRDRYNRYLCCYLADGSVEPRCSHYFKCDKKYIPKKLLVQLERQMNPTGSIHTEDITMDKSDDIYNNEYDYGYWRNYDMPVYNRFLPHNFRIFTESLLRSRGFHSGLIITGMIGIFLGLFFYIRFHSENLWIKRRRAENIDSYMSDIDSKSSSATSESDSESTPSISGDSTVYFSYQSSQSSL
ncbi:CYIR protein [Plasmodium cynomolgi strain B]|uniref:CYIR protein n=1 Tax=Plasmodium cynomolgi (strain B) TaxID=1120755 RepID=K6UNF4_PLACD|nr:CYIR protein [Plasmodium cynomolgi strain B]GAB69438.1 CYIR protein [Plasmodium cynomolgi strain B]